MDQEITRALAQSLLIMNSLLNGPTKSLRLEFYDQANSDLIASKPWPNIPVPAPGDSVVLTVEPPLVWHIQSRLYFFHPDNRIVVEYTVKQSAPTSILTQPGVEQLGA